MNGPKVCLVSDGSVLPGGRVRQRHQASVVIVGGGIAGLAAAFFLRDTPFQVTVLEGSPRLGGKLAVSDVAGVAVDEGAEALLARRPEGIGLIGAVGLAGDLVWPGTTAARVWSRGEMHPLPRRQFMGVPADLGELAASGLVSAAGLARARRDLALPATARDDDVAVAGYVASRLGQEVVDRLVDPLLAGVYAGRSEELSFEATLPALASESRRHASLSEAAGTLIGGTGRQAPRPEDSAPPVFTTLAAGLGTLPAAVAAASGATVRTSAMVRRLSRTAMGWQLAVGSTHQEECLTADAVVLAAPAGPSARLLAGVPGASPAAAALREIGYASMAIVTLAYPAAAFPGPPSGSGYLVPAVDRRGVKAVTFSSVKWPHLRRGAADLVFVRCSLGRVGEEAVLQTDDDTLAALATRDLAAATGVRGAPAATRVSRWGGALPQYTVGHLGRVASIRAAVGAQPSLAVCGAAYDGIGIPACVATARLAAGQIQAYLAGRGAATAASEMADNGGTGAGTNTGPDGMAAETDGGD
jgi:protoporphyrinogen/coproporphyrinogen III oxidase